MNPDVSMESFGTLFSHTRLGFYRNTPGPQGHFLAANNSIVKMFEADSEAEFMKHNVSDLYQDPNDRQRLSEKIMRQGFVENEEVRLKTLKGRNIIGSITAVLMNDQQGQPYFDGMIEDITQVKAREAELISRSAELERINKILIDRELMMVQLKTENAALRASKS